MGHKVTFLPQNITIECENDETILEVALANEIELEHNCGGNCCCTTCHIIIREGEQNLTKMEEEEEDRLEECAQLTPKSRLGCQCRVKGDVMIEIPERDPFKLDGLQELEGYGEELLNSGS